MRKGILGLAVSLAAAGLCFAQAPGARERPARERPVPMWQQVVDSPELASELGFSAAEVQQLRQLLEAHDSAIAGLRTQMQAVNQQHRERLINLVGEERAEKVRQHMRQQRMQQRQQDAPARGQRPEAADRPRRERPADAERPAERPRRRMQRQQDDDDDDE